MPKMLFRNIVNDILMLSLTIDIYHRFGKVCAYYYSSSTMTLSGTGQLKLTGRRPHKKGK